MSRRQRIDCPHERRPGMAVCLHCLHAHRLATRARRQRAVLRFTLWTMGLGIVGVVAAAGAGAVAKGPAQEIAPRPVSKAAAAKTSSVISDTTLGTAQVLQQGTVVSSAASKPDTTRQPATVAMVDSIARPAPSAPATPSTPSIVPKLRQGRTEFADSVYAVRSGD